MNINANSTWLVLSIYSSTITQIVLKLNTFIFTVSLNCTDMYLSFTVRLVNTKYFWDWTIKGEKRNTRILRDKEIKLTKYEKKKALIFSNLTTQPSNNITCSLLQQMEKQQDQDFGSSTVSITLPSLETKIIPSFTL